MEGKIKFLIIEPEEADAFIAKYVIRHVNSKARIVQFKQMEKAYSWLNQPERNMDNYVVLVSIDAFNGIEWDYLRKSRPLLPPHVYLLTANIHLIDMPRMASLCVAGVLDKPLRREVVEAMLGNKNYQCNIPRFRGLLNNISEN